jgi:hypothetical protein
VRLFLAGIMQGSRLDNGIHSQDYREVIKSALQARYQDVELFCPFETHPTSVDYDEATGKRTFLELIQTAAEADGVIAYVPEASMGTAIEIWEAYLAGKPVFTISPLSANWAIRFLSTEMFDDLDAFVGFVEAGGLDPILKRYLKNEG